MSTSQNTFFEFCLTCLNNVFSFHKIKMTLLKKCPHSELFWSAFSRIWTRITPNTDTFYAGSQELNKGMIVSKGHLNNNGLLEFSRSDEGKWNSQAIIIYCCNISKYWSKFQDWINSKIGHWLRSSHKSPKANFLKFDSISILILST